MRGINLDGVINNVSSRKCATDMILILDSASLESLKKKLDAVYEISNLVFARIAKFFLTSPHKCNTAVKNKCDYTMYCWNSYTFDSNNICELLNIIAELDGKYKLLMLFSNANEFFEDGNLKRSESPWSVRISTEATKHFIVE